MHPVLIDLTAAPYHCDPTGKRDCTAALCRALDDAMESDRQLQLAAIARMSLPGATAEGPETKPSGVHFHRDAPPAVILHLPTGTYRVSGSIGYSWHDHVNSKNGDHLARGIHWRGDGPERTIIRLDDRCPGFDAPDGRPVFQILRGLKSAVCMQNSVEGLRIETGIGNPGAIGLDFYSNNSGAVRDVAVVSGDGHGIAGVAIRSWNSSCALLQRITVRGFQFGVQVLHHRLYTVLEDITVHGQSRSGVLINEHNVSLHRLKSHNRVPALTVIGDAAHVVAIDVDAAGGGTEDPAIAVRSGVCLARDVRIAGYTTAIAHRDGFPMAAPTVAEWCSHPTWKLFPDQPGGTLRLPIRDTPVPGCGRDERDWTCIDAVGDGIHDDTEAIDRALRSGVRCLRFPQGRFRITRQIRIPATVERLDFGYADLESGVELKAMDDRGAFLVGDGDAPLFIERLFTMTGFMGRHRLLEQDGVRTLVLRDLHTQYNGLYSNSVPGSDVFIENCACTCEGAGELPGWRFLGQRVWARQLNPERSHVQVINDGGDLWVLGFKTENPSTAFLTRNGGRTEILGGIFNQLRQYHPGGATWPTIINDASQVSVSASTTDGKANRSFEGPAHVLVREIRAGVIRDLVWEVLPLRQPHLVTIPLYTGRS